MLPVSPPTRRIPIDNYTLWDHGTFLRDSVRVDGYVRAIRETLNVGSVVLEIGTGTGFFAAVAAELGARHVDAEQ